MAKIGGRLKILRQRRQLSIRLLSLRSGVSHSTISLIERDRVSPSLDTLSAILEAMGSTLIGFLSDEPQGAINPFYRLADQPEIGNENGISYRIIGWNHPNRRFQFLKETYQMDAGSGTRLRHEAQEAGVVLSGHIWVAGGESGRYPGGVRHRPVPAGISKVPAVRARVGGAARVRIGGR